ncbi:hypothetical protein AAIL08_001681 [Campylobacter upsaliensis]|uniref:hypothetical protein n=1 Tax=Campylobacter upsaliensis TaxID=28080 RepID=UPI000E11A514|nr:hypothetical protein [Campylobacter upsaliensis]EDP6892520.1 hypothetical protein [Campylobacter upsaliensis]EHD8285409.1 hypothetical protein [Campylobacter upsaliensis]EKM1541389.1 hypothetical protein [Campylobacter upsaliensis]CAG9467947.1 hypothetical protein CU14913_000055 [Campylobacter upsaliensis]SUX14951.1 Uncharacterised protein [Campylobacter upsaliensis]
MKKSIIKSFRFDLELCEFLQSLSNSNQFVIQILKDTQEFKDFQIKKEAMSEKNQPSLF